MSDNREKNKLIPDLIQAQVDEKGKKLYEKSEKFNQEEDYKLIQKQNNLLNKDQSNHIMKKFNNDDEKQRGFQGEHQMNFESKSNQNIPNNYKKNDNKNKHQKYYQNSKTNNLNNDVISNKIGNDIQNDNVNMNHIHFYDNKNNLGNIDILKHNKEIQNSNQNKNTNQQEIPSSNELSKKYKKATTTGLINLGKTSYLNAVLQLLGSFEGFVSYFTNHSHAKYINENYSKIQLSFVLFRLFRHLYPYPEKEEQEKYNPQYVKQVLSKFNIVYNSNNERNPNDLILFILETLHNELNKSKNNKFIDKKPDIYDKCNVLECGYHFSKSNESMVSNLLFWSELVESKCSECSCITYKLLSFPLFEIGIMEAYNSFKKTLTIYDCLKFYESPKTQKIFCERCKNYNLRVNRSKIFSSSNILIFSLNRKNLDQNLMKIPFQIDDKIDIRNFIENKEFQFQYELTGIISFYISQNKYVSFCMSPIDNHWYIYNDESIESTQLNDVINWHNSEKKFIPCILAYKLKKFEN